MSNVTPLPQKLHVTQPAPLSLECIRNPVQANKSAMICWCPESHFGGLYFIDLGMWHTFGPLDDFEAFKRFLLKSFPEAVKQ